MENIKLEPEDDTSVSEQGASDDVTSVNMMDHMFTIETEQVQCKTDNSNPILIETSVKIEPINSIKEELTQEQEQEQEVDRMVHLKPLFVETCDHCNKTFYCKKTLQKHIETVRSFVNYEQQEKLNNTDKNISITKKLNQSSHTNSGPYKCDVCGKGFPLNCRLTKHMRSHTGEKRFKCDVCQKSFMQGSNLRLHMTSHTDEKPYKCDVCDKIFSQEAYLKKHMKRTHNDDRPSYKCNICEKFYLERSYLKLHMRSHTGDKPYKCDVCEKSFSLKFARDLHMQMHTGHKPYECDVCSKSFGVKHRLIVHIRSHTGEKPYTCHYCEKRLSSNHRRLVHMQSHTKEHMRSHTQRKSKSVENSPPLHKDKKVGKVRVKKF